MTAITEPAALRITLFGPMNVLVHGQSLPSLRSRKSLYILALLTLRYPRPVEREWLAGTLWPDSDPVQGLANLRPALSALREALGRESQRIESPSRHALRLDLTGAAGADIQSFEAAIEDGSPSALARAVSLYTGPLLEGCVEEWVFQERAAREQDCLRALQKLGDAALSDGDFAQAAHYFQRVVALSPLSDAARRGLMQARAKGGDINAALQAYREFVQLLREDSRSVPDEKTTALYQSLRTEARQGAVAAATPKITSPPVVTGYLPHALTQLIGREDERMEVASCFRRSRLVTLTGPGGIGKTRLAVAVADEVVGEFPDGVWMVSLEALTDPALLPQAVAHVLGLKEAASGQLLPALLDFLRTKRRLLLTLDNCEHLLEASTELASRLLRECAGVRILATSREPLGVGGEFVWAVPALSFPDPAHLPAKQTALTRILAGYDSVRLFVERAQAVQRSFALTVGNAPAVAQICARLEGVPLAIELAAARVNSLTTEQIAARLDDHLNLLKSNVRTALSRQQTLRATLDWSYALLREPERSLLARLSVFAEGWTLEAAEAVGQGKLEILDLLGSLTEKSLVAFADQEAGGRYRLLEMVRQYGAEKLAETGETNTVKAHHRNYFLALAEAAEPELTEANQAVWLRRLETEQANLRAALDWCKVEDEGAKAGLQMAGALRRYWEIYGLYHEGRSYLSDALTRTGAGERTKERARALNGAGTLAYFQSDYAAAQVFVEESLTIYREGGDRRGIAWSLDSLADISGAQGKSDASHSLYAESLSIFREMGDQRGIASMLHHLGKISREQGDFAQARSLYEESLSIRRLLEDKEGVAWSLHHLGNVASSQGDLVTAQTLQEEGLTIFRELGVQQGMAWVLNDLGDVAVARNDQDTARLLYEESLGIFREVGDRHGIAAMLHRLANTALMQADRSAARSLYQESLTMYRAFGNHQGVGLSLTGLGRVALDKGDFGEARVLYTEGIRLLDESNDRRGVVECLEGLAVVAMALSDVEGFVRLWAAAAAQRESLNVPLPPSERERHDHSLTQARRVLGDDRFSAVQEAGRVQSWEQIKMSYLS